MFGQGGCCELALAQPVAAAVKTPTLGCSRGVSRISQGFASCRSPGDNFSTYFSVLFQVKVVRGQEVSGALSNRTGWRRNQSRGFPMPMAAVKHTVLKGCQGSRAKRCLHALGQNTGCWLTWEQEARGAGLSSLSGEVPPASSSWHW